MLETGNMAIGLSAGGAWRVSGQRACPAAHGIACREVAQRSMHFDRHVARSNVECPSGPTADAPAHQPLTNDHGAGWPLCRGQGVSGTRDTSRASWVVRWVVGAVSVNRRRASGGFRPFGVASCLPDFSLNHVEQDPDLRQHCFCVAENCGLCGIRMKENYFCTKTKKIQKKSQKSSENR